MFPYRMPKPPLLKAGPCGRKETCIAAVYLNPKPSHPRFGHRRRSRTRWARCPRCRLDQRYGQALGDGRSWWVKYETESGKDDGMIGYTCWAKNSHIPPFFSSTSTLALRKPLSFQAWKGQPPNKTRILGQIARFKQHGTHTWFTAAQHR